LKTKEPMRSSSLKEREGALMVFSVNFKNGKRYSFRSPMFGMQNLMNLGSMIAFLKCEGFDLKDKKLHEVIENMKGIKRRQELIGSINGGLVYSDFAHHPTAAKLTLESFLQFFPEKRCLSFLILRQTQITRMFLKASTLKFLKRLTNLFSGILLNSKNFPLNSGSLPKE
jgi:UDP-N-acetylmuramate-alanine ligase